MNEKKYFTKENIEEMKRRDIRRLYKLAELVKHGAAIGAGELLMNEPEIFDLVYPWIKYGKEYAEGLYKEARENIEFSYEACEAGIDRSEMLEEVLKQNQTLIELLQKSVSNNSSDHRELTKLIVAKKK